MKKYIPWVIVAVLIGGAVAYKMYNKPHAETKDATADIVITPADLLKAYETDETAADKAYLDKIIEVEGVVKSVNQVEQGASLSLETGNDMAAIICEFESNNALENVKAGDKVRVKGFCSGKLMDIVLVRCSL